MDPTEKPVPHPAPTSPENDAFPRTEQEPVPGVEHQPEPDAENIMPAEDQPGTF